MDFTLRKYRQLLLALKQQGYHFVTFVQYCSFRKSVCKEGEPWIIIRHDVDRDPKRSFEMAEVEHELGIQASYYFRVPKQDDLPKHVNRVALLGHEVGYHYEDMDISRGNVEDAYLYFNQNLRFLRQLYSVRTIVMHGAPMSKWDGRELWKHYNYRDLGIMGEPYLDLDFSKVFYITDTGRRWDGYNVAVWDKIPAHQKEWNEKGWTYHKTNDIIRAVQQGSFPQQLMMTVHPQRWSDRWWIWIRELVMQNIKNVIKRLLIFYTRLTSRRKD